MMQSKSQDVETFANVVRDAARDLSPYAVAVLAAHPAALKSALAAAADALAAQGARGDGIEIVGGAKPRLIDAKRAARQLASRVRSGSGADFLTSDELAALAGLKTRQSVHDWLKKGRIVGWQGAKRGYVFPAAQLDGRGRPPDGLDRIVPRFKDGYAAWEWLTEPRDALDGATPLAKLRKGEIDCVEAAVEGYFQGDFA